MRFSCVSPFYYWSRGKTFVVRIRNKEEQPTAVSMLMAFVTHPELWLQQKKMSYDQSYLGGASSYTKAEKQLIDAFSWWFKVVILLWKLTLGRHQGISRWRLLLGPYMVWQLYAAVCNNHVQLLIISYLIDRTLYSYVIPNTVATSEFYCHALQFFPQHTFRQHRVCLHSLLPVNLGLQSLSPWTSSHLADTSAGRFSWS